MNQQQKTTHISILILLIILIASIIIPTVITLATQSNTPTTTTQSTPPSISQQIILPPTAPHLLIILTPTYHNDERIITAIQKYQHAITQKPKWTSQITYLNTSTNHPHQITTIIKQTAQHTNLTACLLIGEDIHLPTKTNYQTITKPTLKNWTTIKTQNNTHQRICISLIHPSPSASYSQKQNQIITTLSRFTNKRTLTLKKQSTIIEQSSLSTYSQSDYQKLASTLQAIYHENCNPSILTTLFHTSHDLICLHGHGQPHTIQLNSTVPIKLTSKTTSLFNTSILSIDGCYTDSSYTNQTNNPTPFISTLCQSDTIHVAFFGLLSQQTMQQSNNVINSIFPFLTEQTTIAETINNAHLSHDFIFTGDPTINITL